MKLISVGLALMTIATAVGVAIWQSHPKGGFLDVPGWACITVFVIGLVLVAIGFNDDDDGRGDATQIGGDHSFQQQAGRDIHNRLGK